MTITKTTQPQIGTWAKLSTEQVERAPKVEFEVNKPVVVEFKGEPRELVGADGGVFYVFDVRSNNEDKAIVTSAWTLLRGIKALEPLNGKKAQIIKELTKGKQGFKVIPLVG